MSLYEWLVLVGGLLFFGIGLILNGTRLLRRRSQNYDYWKNQRRPWPDHRFVNNSKDCRAPKGYYFDRQDRLFSDAGNMIDDPVLLTELFGPSFRSDVVTVPTASARPGGSLAEIIAPVESNIAVAEMDSGGDDDD